MIITVGMTEKDKTETRKKDLVIPPSHVLSCPYFGPYQSDQIIYIKSALYSTIMNLKKQQESNSAE